jgi:hypothetical protein
MEVDEPSGCVVTRPLKMLPRQATRKEIRRVDVIAKTHTTAREKKRSR